ncbi:MAG TPA: glycosyltransferase family 4 protein [Solirubrobacteraceae bacterium]|nr:glycosyltransferase family 4 protein [Solirubrobacteraceae bacterium]
MTGHVAIVLHEGHVGGATNAVLRPLAALEAQGWSFCFWAPRPSAVADLLEARGHAVAGEQRDLRYSWAALQEPPGPLARTASVPGYLQAFRRFLARAQPDLVHANTILTIPEALAARAGGRPTLLHVHEMLGGAGRRNRAALLLAGRVDGVVAVSQACAAPLRAAGVRTGIVTAGVDPGPARRAPRRERKVVVGMLGTVCERKGSDVFVDAARATLATRSDVEFRIVGPLAPGAEEAWARAVVARGERAGVRWKGSTADAAVELATWDVFVLPTRRDPFPLVVLEAMAAGLPVVATAVDGVPEQVDEACATLVAPDDAPALAGAIERLAGDARARLALGRAGADRAATHFTPARNSRELATAYEWVLATGSLRNGARRPLP